MKKILLIAILVCLSTLLEGRSHFHHSHHSTYHHHSHGHNGYSKPRKNYYNHPIKYFPITHHYYNHYHHYHLGNNKDTIFCDNENHDIPIIESKKLSIMDVIWFIIIVGGIIILVCKFLL